MRAPFEGFDFQDFWEPTSGPFDPKEKAPPTADVIAEVEATFGVRLPAAYLRLLETQNGGTPNNTCFPTTTPTGWARDHVQISAIFPLGREHRSSLLGEHGAAFWRQEWGYPDFGICIADTPSGGHEMIMLDYSGCGPRGEPSVVYVDQESDYEVTFLAVDFESFICGLVNESLYDDSVERLALALRCVEHGSFTPLLAGVAADDPAIGLALRRICLELTREKGHFSLHADERSRLVYDVLFYAYGRRHPVPDAEAYLAAYPAMLVVGDGGFTTGGYAPAFVEDWLKDARASGSIVASPGGGLSFSAEARARVVSAIAEWGR